MCPKLEWFEYFKFIQLISKEKTVAMDGGSWSKEGGDGLASTYTICSCVDLRLGSKMSRLRTIDERCDLFDHCIENLA